MLDQFLWGHLSRDCDISCSSWALSESLSNSGSRSGTGLFWSGLFSEVISKPLAGKELAIFFLFFFLQNLTVKQSCVVCVVTKPVASTMEFMRVKGVR